MPAVGFWMLETPTTNSIATGDRLMQERVTIVRYGSRQHKSAMCWRPRAVTDQQSGWPCVLRGSSAACVVDAKVRSVVKETATWLANALGQEAVFVKINNQPYLIRMTSERCVATTHIGCVGNNQA